MKPDAVGSKRQIDPRFRLVIGFLIILREPFPNFGRSRPDYGLEIRVIFRISPEHLNSQGPFLQLSRMSIERALDDIAQKCGVSPAVREQRIRQKPFELGLDRGTVDFGFRHASRGAHRGCWFRDFPARRRATPNLTAIVSPVSS